MGFWSQKQDSQLHVIPYKSALISISSVPQVLPHART